MNNRITSIVLFFPLLVSALSCKTESMKQYTYIEYREGKDTITKIITAPNDSVAYVNSYEMFCISEDLFESYPDEYRRIRKKPLFFTVQNSEGIILHSISEDRLKAIKTEIDHNVLGKPIAPIIKDSVDILIEQRAEMVFDETIYGGLRFGSPRQSVEMTLKKNPRIALLMPDGDLVGVVIRDHDATYYNGGLASLVLYANEGRLIDSLYELYTRKYGKTKNRKWVYSNCEISVKQRIRREHNPHKDAGYGQLDSHRIYYDSYRGEKTYRLIKAPYFLEISYKNTDLLEKLERQKFVADSLEKEKLQRELQKERELAKKVAAEAVNNI